MIINLKKLIVYSFGCLLILFGLLFFLYGIFGIDNKENKEVTESSSVVMGEIDPSQPMVALTYDDGPYGPVTVRILESLKSVNGKATFFIVGDRIEGREETVKKIVEYGCEIGNHTYNHTQLNKLSKNSVKEQLSKTDEKVLEVTGYQIKLVRPPAGCYNKVTLSADNRNFVLWSIDTLDWSHQNSAKTVKKVLDNVQDGDIILMHDLFFATATASEELIPELVKSGYQLVTVSELIQYRQESSAIVMNNS